MVLQWLPYILIKRSMHTTPLNFSTNIASYEFTFWVARNFQSVDAVKQALNDVTIVHASIDTQHPAYPVRWMIADSVHSIVVECDSDGMHVYDNPVDVMTDGLAFAQQIEHIQSMTAFEDYEKPDKLSNHDLMVWHTGQTTFDLPIDGEPYSRFARSAYINLHYPQQVGTESNIARMFASLTSVAMSKGEREYKGNEIRTLYTSVFDSSKNTYYLRTVVNPTITTFALNQFDLNANTLLTHSNKR